LLQDGDVGVGVFPEGEEVLIGGAGFRCVARENVGTGNAEMCQGSKRTIPHQRAAVEEILPPLLSPGQ